MQLVDRIEKRRFVGREFLLFVWFESEVFEATFKTAGQGTFGLWIEGQIVLSAGKETTRIRGATPAVHREAKEALLLGKLPELAGFHLARAEEEWTFVLKADRLALSGVKLPTVLGAKEEAPVDLGPRKGAPRRRKTSASDDALEDAHESHEAFYERMNLTRDLEAILEGLYGDFLRLRLGPAWEGVVIPAIASWATGAAVDADAYAAAKTAASPHARGTGRGKRA